jgi:UDP-N-acetyl-D-glucosamine dehydrogenase
MSIDISAISFSADVPREARPVVCVQGLGYVGTAMALAIASARDEGVPAFDVIGVELPNERGAEIVHSINTGQLPIESADPKMQQALDGARENGNLSATTDLGACEFASVAVVSVNLDLQTGELGPTVDLSGLRAAVRDLASKLQPGALIVVETTVPPGTCSTVLLPEIESVLSKRGLPAGSLMLAYSYERVMPGPDYFDSVRSYWRVYAGETPEAADACDAFLSRVVDVDNYPLSRVGSTTAAEMGKVLENSYRATNIAFMEEWGRFAEAIGVDLFEVIEAIRVRPTHSNMRQPGFGVGGYCLTKDPLFAQVAARDLFGLSLDFPFSKEAVRVNGLMPFVTLDRIDHMLGGLDDRRLLVLGASYRGGVADTRHSPSAAFASAAIARGADVVCHDPLVTEWELPVPPVQELPEAAGFDAVVFAVIHDEYLAIDLLGWLGDARPVVVDANHVLLDTQLREAANAGCRVWSIGRGDIGA